MRGADAGAHARDSTLDGQARMGLLAVCVLLALCVMTGGSSQESSVGALAAQLLALPLLAWAGWRLLRQPGSAMVSTGGEFVTAPSGSQLAPGSRVMLTEGNQATLVYANGCTQSLTTAGVHAVAATCVRAPAAAGGAGTGATGVDLGGAAIVSGVAVAGAAILNSMDDQDYVAPPPVSR